MNIKRFRSHALMVDMPSESVRFYKSYIRYAQPGYYFGRKAKLMFHNTMHYAAILPDYGCVAVDRSDLLL